MDAEGKFWITVWLIAGTVISVLIISATVSSMQSDRLVSDAIKNGADPIAARCAFSTTATFCPIYIATKGR